MQLSSKLLSFAFILKLVIEVGGNDDSLVYFPSEEKTYQRNNIQQSLVPGSIDLTSIRGTNSYERYVDAIIAGGINRLSLKINNLLQQQSRNNKNVLFSPMSIAGVMALILMGSNGITFKQVTEFWGLETGIPDIGQKSQVVHEQFARMINKLSQTSGFQLGEEITFASAIFVQNGYPIRPIYKSTAQELYQSNILNVDFEVNPEVAQRLINDWVAEKTRQKIKNIISDVPSSDTKVILASALYFNAEWESHFFPGSTSRKPFYVDGRKSKTTIKADMMANGGEFPYYKDLQLGCEILGLPYKGNRSTMYVVMPFESSRQRLQEFESKLTEADLYNLVSKTKQTDAVILFPRMKIESTIDLKETLKLLGVTSLFNPHEANLGLLSPGQVPVRSQLNHPTEMENNLNSNVSFTSRTGFSESIDNIRQQINEQSTDNKYQNPGLYADKVIHKVFMDITEKGTEAAAATSVSLTRAGGRVTFRVDVPFFFFIRHEETNTILFWGSVIIPNPSYSNL